MRACWISLLANLLLLAVVTPALSESAAGRWRGVLALASGEVEVEIELRRSDGGWSGTLAAPSLELEDLELGDFAVEDGSVAFTVAGLGNGVRLTGALSGDGGKLTGESAEGPPGAPPATDIFLFELGDLDDWEPEPPLNITDRDGYDNQPSFLPDGSGLLYTSIREGQADVYRYSLADGSTHRMTDTPESEYSPTPRPGGGAFTTVRVESDGSQRLWSFPLAAGEPRLVLEDVQPVGYHTWLSDYTVALFVLGDPPTLELVHLETRTPRRLADNIGRSLHMVPESGHLSFVRKVGERWFIDAYDPWIEKEYKLVETRPGSEDFAWTADGRILMGEGSRLYGYRDGPRAEIDPWVEMADLEAFGVRDITRLALSPDQRQLAVVGSRPVPLPPAPAPRPFELERQ